MPTDAHTALATFARRAGTHVTLVLVTIGGAQAGLGAGTELWGLLPVAAAPVTAATLAGCRTG
jgi:phosphoribosylcarboxyaminoimidazole (NCAIR) mutase